MWTCHVTSGYYILQRWSINPMNRIGPAPRLIQIPMNLEENIMLDNGSVGSF